MKNLNHLTNFVSIIAAVLVAVPAFSGDVLAISEAIATGKQGNLPRLKLWEGAGLNIHWQRTGEFIEKVWLDDPSRITLDFDADINSGNAQSIHLRRINSIKFRNLPQTSTTLLTIITNKNRYQFVISYGQGNPDYYGVTITQAQQSISTGLDWSTHVRQGLSQARELGLIAPDQGNQVLVERVEQVLSLVANGESVADAAFKTGVSLAFLNRLETMGQMDLKPSPTLSFDTIDFLEFDNEDLFFEWK